MYIAGYIVTGFVVAAVYAFARLRGQWGRYERTALTIPLTIAALASPVQILVGDWAARDVATTQPTKLAAIEGLYKTTSGAPEHLLGWYTDNRGQVRDRDPAPALAALVPQLERDGPGTRHRARRPAPAGQRRARRVPDDGRDRHAARRCSASSTSAIWVRRRRLPESVWFYRAVVLAGPLSVVALIAGWVVTEVGRQPWVVYKVMPTAAAVTGAHGIPVGYAALAASYVVVAAGLAWVLRRLARMPLEAASEAGVGVGDAACSRCRWCSCSPGWRCTRCSAGADFGAGFWQLIAGRAASAASASASTRTTRWARCGRPTTSG